MRAVLLLLPVLAACGREAPPAANQASPPPERAAPESEVAAAERLVRQRIGTTGETHFFDARRTVSDGVPIVCGVYEQGGVRHRYIVVNREQAFVEPRMRPGEMERAVAEFCRENRGNGPPARAPERGEKG